MLINRIKSSKPISTALASPAAAGFAFAVGAAALFAIRPVFVKLVYLEGVDSTTLIALRMLFSVPIYIVLLVYFLRDSEYRKRLTRKNIAQIIGVGLIGYYIASYLDLLGLQYLSAQLGRMILYTYPTFVVLLGALFFGERITVRIVLSLIITYLGISVIFGHDFALFGDDVAVGSLLILTSAAIFSLYLLFGKSLIDQVGSKLFTSIALIGASIGIFVHFSLTHSITDAQVNNQALMLILFIAVFCTVIPTFFTAAALARIGADRTGIISTVGPAFTSVFAVMILNENFTIYHFVGIILTVAGVSLLRKR